MNTRKKKCADPILEMLGLGHLYLGKRPLVWIPDLYSRKESAEKRKTDSSELHDKSVPYDTGETDLSEYFVKTKTDGPYASLLSDVTFKKAFSPDTETGKANLINLLNDMLKGQILCKIKDVSSQQSELNDSGSKASRTSIFDLHCIDEEGRLIEIEVQLRRRTNFLKRLAFYSSQMVVKQGKPGRKWNHDIKPTYVIAIARHTVFNDGEAIHRAGILDYKTHEQWVDCANFTVVELSKIKRIVCKKDDDATKWMFVFRYLNRLERLPPALNAGKFKGLLEPAKIARFNKKELERYRRTMYTEWDRYGEEEAFAEDHPEYIKKIGDEAVAKVNKKFATRDKKIAKFLQSIGVSSQDIASAFAIK